MRRVTALLATVLALCAYDLALIRRTEDGCANIGAISLTADAKKRYALRLRRRANVIPERLRGGRAPVRAKVNHFSNEPRDVRYSDQRKIRRRINNL